MTREEAIRHIRDVIAENNSIKPNIITFEQEKEALYMAIEALSAEVVHKTDIVRRIEEALSAETMDVEGCDGCRYDTRIPQKQCLRCSRYWRDNYEYKDGDDE